MKNKFVMLTAMTTLLMGLYGCNANTPDEPEDGPAERAGEQIDETVKSTHEQMGEIQDDAKNVVEEMEKQTNESMEAAKKKLEEMGDQLEKATDDVADEE